MAHYIEKACDWLNRNDSYATPTNVKVNELRKFLEDSMQDASKPPCMYNRTLEERKRGCRFCSAACKGRIKESESDVDTQIKSQNEAIKNLNDALNRMEHGGHLPEINAAESQGIPQEEYDKIVDECIYGKEVELVDTNTWLKEESVSDPENLEKEVDRLCELYHFTATLGEIRFIASHFANWGKKQAEIEIQAQSMAIAHRCPKEDTISEDLEEACEQLAENARKHKAETLSPFFSQTDYKQGVIDGAKWQLNKIRREYEKNRG